MCVFSVSNNNNTYSNMVIDPTSNNKNYEMIRKNSCKKQILIEK